MTADLTQFLLARIADTEAIAKAADPAPHDRSWHEPIEWREMPDHARPGPGQVRHIAEWHPARVLAECEAKRERIETLLDDWWVGNPILRDRLLGIEALPYADHPDYREEWRP